MGKEQYGEDFKREAVRLMTEEGYSQAEASRSLGVSQTTLSEWRKTYEPAQKRDLEAENKELRERNRQLEAERDILKKAATFFAKEQR